MPDQDIAQEWKSFDEAKRTRLLTKMTSDQKRNLRRAIEGGAVSDFTSNDKGEGLYRMGSYDYKQGITSKPEIKVPFSKVERAQAAGYKLHPDEVPGYSKDFKYRGQGPTWYQRVDQHIQNVLTPESNIGTPPVSALHQAFGGGGAATQARRDVRNVARAGGRLVYGMPGYAKQVESAAADSVRAGKPSDELLDLVDPAAVPHGMIQQYQEDRKTDPRLAVQNLIGTLGGLAVLHEAGGRAMEVPGKVVRTLPELRRMAEAKYGPRDEEISGVRIPIGVGEERPTSRDGRKYNSLKRRGVRAPEFEKFEQEQQAQVKEVIRKVAQRTIDPDFTAGYPREPGAVVQNAADVIFNRARPVYAALDVALRGRTANLGNVSEIVRSAMQRAKKLGVDFGDGGAADISKIVPEQDGTIQWGGSRISKATHPDRWAELVDDGIIDDRGQGTPLTAARKLVSELRKMRQSSGDAALRYQLSREIKTIDRAMNTALTGTPLYDNWKEADKLWAKAHAMEDVGEAVRNSTKGTPQTEQHPGLRQVPTKVTATSLESSLNDLADDGTLDRAFTKEEASNLRKSIDILARIQRTHVGAEEETVSHRGGLSHALGGAKWPIIGVIGGGTLEAVTGGNTMLGVTTGATAGYLLQLLHDRRLARVMTRSEGVRVLKEIEAARTPTQLQAAVRKLQTVMTQTAAETKVVTGAALAASAAQPKKKSLRELRAEAARRKPAGSPGVPSQYDVVTGTTASPR